MQKQLFAIEKHYLPNPNHTTYFSSICDDAVSVLALIWKIRISSIDYIQHNHSRQNWICPSHDYFLVYTTCVLNVSQIENILYYIIQQHWLRPDARTRNVGTMLEKWSFSYYLINNTSWKQILVAVYSIGTLVHTVNLSPDT